MIKQLYIQNFTLIDELNIDFHSGFSVITGETGAGKSIILGAIGLLLGNRADMKQIKAGADKCVVEAHFDLSQYQLEEFFEEEDIDYDPADTILRREITSKGKSRAFINDTPAALSSMKRLGEHLIDVHSQHQNLLLQKENFQLNVVDIIAHNADKMAEYKLQYQQYQQLSKQLQQLIDDIESSKQQEEYLSFQFNELENAQLNNPEEQDELEQKIQELSHVEDIKSALFGADSILNADEMGIDNLLRQASHHLHNIENVYPDAGELAERIDSSRIEIQDIAHDISVKAENVDFDPEELERMNNRIDIINSLEQKYHVNDLASLIEIKQKIEEQLNNISHGDEEVEELKKKVQQQHDKCQQQAAQLTTLRKKAGAVVEKEMQQLLVPLGIPHVRFKVDIQPKELSLDGADSVSFLFSANTSTPLQPVSDVASGGEIARVMLSLKAMISNAVKLPTIIFDEIDTGVSGRIAEKMAQIMKEMGQEGRQVISITHLPQIAAMGTTHYKVSKEETAQGTISHMRQLNTDERINEIAQMLSGSEITPEAINNAKAIMKH